MSVPWPAWQRPLGLNIRFGVLYGLIDGEDEASGFAGSSDGIGLHHGWLPHTCLKVVCDGLLGDVHTIPHVSSCVGGEWNNMLRLNRKEQEY